MLGKPLEILTGDGLISSHILRKYVCPALQILAPCSLAACSPKPTMSTSTKRHRENSVSTRILRYMATRAQFLLRTLCTCTPNIVSSNPLFPSTPERRC